MTTTQQPELPAPTRIQRIKCRLGFHDLKNDGDRIGGVWWAFCKHCGARYVGEYDPCYGETRWKPF